MLPDLVCLILLLVGLPAAGAAVCHGACRWLVVVRVAADGLSHLAGVVFVSSGVALAATRPDWGQPVVLLAVGAYSVAVFFRLATLPAEIVEPRPLACLAAPPHAEAAVFALALVYCLLRLILPGRPSRR